MIKDSNKPQAAKTPLEDLRRSALEHYREASSKLCHWSSFVESAINAYNPEASHQPKEDKPEWEILRFYYDNPNNCNRVTLMEDRLYYYTQSNQLSGTLEMHLRPDSKWGIDSVKRLSDGEVFSVGDEAGKDGYENGKIVQFKIAGSDMYVVINHQLHHTINFRINEIQKSKPKEELKEPDRIKCFGIISSNQPSRLGAGNYDSVEKKYYSTFGTDKKIPDEKLPLIKQAIEQVLNDEQQVRMFDTNYLLVRKSDWEKRYTQEQVDKMMEGVWNAAINLIVSSINSVKYTSYQDYKNSKP